MKNQAKTSNNHSNINSKNSNGFIPNSFKFISSCIKTASSGVRSASASVAASISGDSQDQKDQVVWACFDRLELSPYSFKHVLLLGYVNGFQVLDVEDASNVSELVSRRDDPVTFLQIQPLPAKSEGDEGFRSSHPLLLVVACDESQSSWLMQHARDGVTRDGNADSHSGNFVLSPTAVRFYSLRSHNYVHVLRFRSTVYMVRCSPQVVAVGLATQIYCFDALTLESKFSVLTYAVPQLVGQGTFGINIGYGPMALGPRWLAYASSNPLVSNTGRLSPQSLTPRVSPSTSPSSGNLVARYAMESSKQLAAGLINLGDMGYKTLSKYYQELVPDGSSSPTSSNSSLKVGRLSSQTADTDIAGMVVVKDIVSRAVISQFRAHTSPISALCFDPSGTLLVTASIHGNNINIFRIIPSSSHNGSGSTSYDWSSSHVHLYKLHRGMTSAVIQDICFSHYSQWIGIITCRGTCHVFALSPFGGESVLQIRNSNIDGPTLTPVLSLPWWSAPSFMTNQHSFSPPPPTVTLSVVSRIKNSNSGWLSTVSNVACTATGKVSIPSGAISAVFHSSVPHDLHPAHLKANVLEHLLVYTPSGHVIQYELLPSLVGEQSETASKTGPSSSMHIHDEELRVKVEPIQWWDVCRRATWPEREEHISGITLCGQESAEMVMDASDCKDDDIGNADLIKPQERSQLYIANSEVQIHSGRIPIWQKSKIYFFTMSLPGDKEQSFNEDHISGEDEIEKTPAYEVDIRRKDLLPVFEHLQRIQSGWSDGVLVGGKSSRTSSDSHGAKDKYSEGAAISHSKLGSSGSAEDSDGLSGVHYPLIFPSVNSSDGEERGRSSLSSALLEPNSLEKHGISVSSKQSISSISPVEDSNFTNSQSTSSVSLPADRTNTKEVQSSNIGGGSDGSNVSSNRSDLSMNILDEGPIHDSLDFEPFFHEEYCKAADLSNCRESREAVIDMDSTSSPCDREKSEEDGDNDDMLGCVFAFSEEG